MHRSHDSFKGEKSFSLEKKKPPAKFFKTDVNLLLVPIVSTNKSFLKFS